MLTVSQRGHPVGDQVLASVGATLRSVLRTRDFAGRKGGEEFAVLLPDTEIAADVPAPPASGSLANGSHPVPVTPGSA